MDVSHLRIEDFRTPVWKRLTQTLHAELQRLRESNDVASKDEIQTALIRGQIKVLKEIIALDASASSAMSNAAPRTWDEATLGDAERSLSAPASTY